MTMGWNLITGMIPPQVIGVSLHRHDGWLTGTMAPSL
jgi:hypothetical protein